MRRALLPLLLLYGLGACSSDAVGSDGPTRAGEGGGTDAPTSGNGGEGGAGANGEACPGAPSYVDPATKAQRVDSVSAVLLDANGEPLADEEVQVCGLDVCIYGNTGPDGGVRVTPGVPMKKPAFKFGDGRENARFAWLLPDEAEIDLGAVSSVRLPPLGEGESLIPGASASSGGLTLSLASNTTVEFDPIVFQTEEEQALRAVELPAQNAPAVVDPKLGFELIYAATPVETTFCPPASVSVPNTPGWDAGSAVELWLHGVDVTEQWAPYGGWAKVSEARVSDDGATIDTIEGLPKLGVIAFKLK